MPHIKKIEDHYEEARSSLPRQFYESPLINAHLKAVADSCQSVEDMLYDGIFADQLLNAAVKSDLDKIGRLYNKEREPLETDEALRIRIIGEILKRNSDGTPDGVREVMQAYTGLDYMRVYQHYTGCPVIIGSTLNESYKLNGTEAQNVLEASPITTGSAVFGYSISDNFDNMLVPAELEFETYNIVVNSEAVLATDIMLVANGLNGLSVLQAPSDGTLTTLYSDPVSGEAKDVLYDGVNAYVAEGSGGISTYVVEKESGGSLTAVANDDQGGLYSNLWRDEYYLYAATVTGLEIYSTDGLGSLVHKSSLTPTDGCNDVWSGNTEQFVIATSKGLESYSIDIAIPSALESIEVSEALNSNSDNTVNTVWGRGDKHLHKNFNGVNDSVQASGLNLGNLDIDFEISSWMDFKKDGVWISQTTKTLDIEKYFEIYTESNEVRVVLGGTVNTFSIDSGYDGYSEWRVLFTNINSTSVNLFLFKGNVFIATQTASIGLIREPTAPLTLMARRDTGSNLTGLKTGFLSDFKFFRDGYKESVVQRHYKLLGDGNDQSLNSVPATISGSDIWVTLEYILAAAGSEGVLVYALDTDGRFYFKCAEDAGGVATSISGSSEKIYSADAAKEVTTYELLDTGELIQESSWTGGEATEVYYYDGVLYKADEGFSDYLSAELADGSTTPEQLALTSVQGMAKKTGLSVATQATQNLVTGEADRLVARINNQIVEANTFRSSLLAELSTKVADLTVDSGETVYDFEVNGEQYQTIAVGIDNTVGIPISSVQVVLPDAAFPVGLKYYP